MSFCCHGMDIMVKEPANHTANSLPANNQNRLYCNTSYLSVKFSKNENKQLMSQNAKATIKICQILCLILDHELLFIARVIPKNQECKSR